jgi:RNA polymerase sigma factor (sigma-70 family)
MEQAESWKAHMNQTNQTNQREDLIPTRRTLLSRLKDWNDQENWRVFFDTYWRLIYNTALKGGLTEAEAQDAVQETVISVMKSMPTFHYDTKKGSFKGWLLQLTRWRIMDQIRKRETRFEVQRGRSGTLTGTATVERVADPVLDVESAWDREWEANLVDAAIERVKQKADPKQYQIYDLLVFERWPPSRVARSLHIRVGWVYLAKHRIGNLIKKEIARLRSKPI